LVRADDRFEVVQPRTLALVCLRVKGTDDLNKKLEEALTASGKLFLSHGVLSGVYYLRFSVGSWKTTWQHVANAWDFIKEETEKLASTSQ
jgi:aromatic-L-amino-acid decarboxylase